MSILMSEQLSGVILSFLSVDIMVIKFYICWKNVLLLPSKVWSNEVFTIISMYAY